MLREKSMREAVYSEEFKQLVTEVRTTTSISILALGTPRISSTVTYEPSVARRGSFQGTRATTMKIDRM
ncbi:hypothetical protein D3C75_1077810 [compost metagenome]